ncbi:MAG: class II aldolase/adducin family protein, partial [Rectinema sp.]
MSMKELVEVSRRYGSDPEFVLAGGGNTSWKTNDTLFVKASGTALATIEEIGFVELDLEAVRAILRQAFPSDSAAREAQVLSALMAARKPGQTMRPSVETILHALFPYSYVVHLHPALVNGV